MAHTRNLSPGTCTKYSQAGQRLADFLHSHGQTLESASVQAVESWAGLVLWKDYKLTAKARKPMVAGVKNLYRYLHGRTDSAITANPTAGLETPKIGQGLGVQIQLHNLEKILKEPDPTTFVGARDLAIMMLLAGTGIRVDTLAKLNESNIRQIRHADVDRYVIRTETKGRKVLETPIPLEAQLALQLYLVHPETQQIDREIPATGDRVLFVTQSNRMIRAADYHGENRRISPKTIDDRIKRYAIGAGIPHEEAHAHAFRHLFGTELAEDGATPHEIQGLMAHADIRSSQAYVHLAIRKKTERSDNSNPLGKVDTNIAQLTKQFFNTP